MKKIDDTTKQRVVTLLQSNRSIENVAKSLGISARTVGRIKKAFLPAFPRLPAGRPRILSTRTLRDINRKVLCGECTTGKAVMRRLQHQGIKLCYQTVWNSLHKIGIFARHKRKKLFLSKKRQIERYRWTIAHRSWTLEDWKRVIFSDETKINLWNSDGVQYCLVKQNSQLQPFHVQETVKHGGGGLMFWGCMTSQGLGYGCQIYDGTMRTNDYIETLKSALKDTREHYGLGMDDFVFQHDNDSKHAAKDTQEYLEAQGINVLPWPSQSRDLNPIESIWHTLKAQIGLRKRRPTSIHELWEIVLEEWEKIPMDKIKSAYESMPHRLQAVIKAKGGHTRY
jgi:transposase